MQFLGVDLSLLSIKLDSNLIYCLLKSLNNEMEMYFQNF